MTAFLLNHLRLFGAEMNALWRKTPFSMIDSIDFARKESDDPIRQRTNARSPFCKSRCYDLKRLVNRNQSNAGGWGGFTLRARGRGGVNVVR
jgi:hypothetical protein